MGDLTGVTGVTGQKEKKEKMKEEKQDKKEKKKFLRAGGQMDEPEVVQGVLADLKTLHITMALTLTIQ